MITPTQRLQAICGKSVQLNSTSLFSVKQYSLNKVLEKNYDVYNYYLRFLTESPLKMIDKLKDTEVYMDLYMRRYEVTKLEMTIMLSHIDEVYKTLIEQALNFFLDFDGMIQIETSSDRILIIQSDNVEVMTSNVLQEIVDLLDFLHSISSQSKDDEDSNPYDEKAKIVLDRMRENREKIKSIKDMSGDNSQSSRGLHDLISAITAKSNSINKINILDLTIYQIYEEFNRLIRIESYYLSVKSVMNGAKDVKVENWDSPI